MRQVVLALAAALLAACGGGSTGAASTTTTSPPIHVAGTLTLSGYGGDPGHACTGSAALGTGDLSPGAQISVTDQASTLIATTSLQAGAVDHAKHCIMTFSVDVPPGKSFYSFEVAHRGAISFSADQLRALGNAVDLKL